MNSKTINCKIESKVKKHIIFYIIVFFTSQSFAGNVDLELQLTIGSTSNLTFGQVINFSITVDNNGPDDAGNEGIPGNTPNAVATNEIFENSNGFSDVIMFTDNSFKQNCTIIPIFASPLPGGLHSVAYIIYLPVIPANSSATCHGKIQIFFEKNNYDLQFNTLIHYLDSDVNLTNNSQQVTLRLKPRVIPTFSLFALLLLLISVSSIGIWQSRKLKHE